MQKWFEYLSALQSLGLVRAGQSFDRWQKQFNFEIVN